MDSPRLDMPEIDRQSDRVLLRCVFHDPERAASIFTGLMARISNPPDEPEPTAHEPAPRAPSSGPAVVELAADEVSPDVRAVAGSACFAAMRAELAAIRRTAMRTDPVSWPSRRVNVMFTGDSPSKNHGGLTWPNP